MKIYTKTVENFEFSLKIGDEFICSERVSSSCYTSGTRRVNLFTNPVINHERGKDLEVITTSRTYQIYLYLVTWLMLVKFVHHIHCILVDRCLSFCTFSSGHCVGCSSAIYGFWFPLWCLQTILTSCIAIIALRCLRLVFYVWRASKHLASNSNHWLYFIWLDHYIYRSLAYLLHVIL
jgi:hypothetical protein